MAFFELSEWTITLKTGEIVIIYADSHGEENGYRSFHIVIEGKPLSLLEIARFRDADIKDIECMVGRVAPDQDLQQKSAPPSGDYRIGARVTWTT